MSSDLFAHAAARDQRFAPLAERMRPATVADVVGQEALLGPGGILRRLLDRKELPSMLLWGPPGCGKTTLARLLAREIGAQFEPLSAVLGGVKELRVAVERATQLLQMHRKRTLLFVDEIHRFNKAQQDALLPHVEAGRVTLVGATTENPSFEVNAALLSRCRVVLLQALDAAAMATLARRALDDATRGLGGRGLRLADDALAALGALGQGDGRRVLSTLEVAAELAAGDGRQEIARADVEQASQAKTLLYDKAGDEHFAVVSAFIKSMRGSDPDAALYYMVRMLEAGESPRFVLRRMVIFASEDIGNADPRALQVAVSALQAFELVGLPEGVLPLTQAVTYLSCAAKSHSVIVAYGRAREAVQAHGALAVPKHLRNATHGLARAQGFGQGYQYPHDHHGHHVRADYLPEALRGQTFYTPSDQGEEVAAAARLRAWRGEKDVP